MLKNNPVTFLKRLLTNTFETCIIIQVANWSGKHERVSYNIKESLDWPAKILKKKFKKVLDTPKETR